MDSGPDPPIDRDSSFRLEIALSIGYKRRRAIAGAIETNVTSLVLLVGGVFVTLLVVWAILQIVGKLPI